jgi:hypothetical protein
MNPSNSTSTAPNLRLNTRTLRGKVRCAVVRSNMTITAASTIVQRLWSYCNLLRDDGMSYGDYVEQLACTTRLRP